MEDLNTEDTKFVETYSWMLRPCQMYKEELKDCKSLRSRVHQYFVFGSMVDCTQWYHDLDNCQKWEKSHDVKAFKEVILSEKIRQHERLKNHYANDVWTRRYEPPRNWNDPLPKHLEERNEGSYLSLMKAQEQEQVEGKTKKSSFCSIM